MFPLLFMLRLGTVVTTLLQLFRIQNSHAGNDYSWRRAAMLQKNARGWVIADFTLKSICFTGYAHRLHNRHIVGRGQVVRHQVLVLAFGGSNPSIPAMKIVRPFGLAFFITLDWDPNPQFCIAKRRGVRHSEWSEEKQEVFFWANERRSEALSCSLLIFLTLSVMLQTGNSAMLDSRQLCPRLSSYLIVYR